MRRSPPLRHLRERRHSLRLDFLPRRFSKLGNYDMTMRQRAGAFRVFFNSELENYFEEVARLVAKKCEVLWDGGQTNRVFAAVTSRNTKAAVNMPQETGQIQGSSFLSRRFANEITEIRGGINSNNGAKSSNVLKLFVPLGIDESQIDPALLSECDTLGSDRGLLAHSTMAKVNYLIDPRTEYDRALLIISLLDQFEALLDWK